jgi:hypothetical protein
MFVIAFLLPVSRKGMEYEADTPLQGNLRLRESPLVILRQQFRHFVRVLFTPLEVFKPRSIPGQPHRRNYNLILLGISIFLYFLSNVSPLFVFVSTSVKGANLQGIQVVKRLYSQHVYKWTTQQVRKILIPRT